MFNKKKNTDIQSHSLNEILKEFDLAIEEKKKKAEWQKGESVLNTYKVIVPAEVSKRSQTSIEKVKKDFYKKFDKLNSDIQEIFNFNEEEEKAYRFLEAVHFNDLLKTSYEYEMNMFKKEIFSMDSLNTRNVSEFIVYKDDISEKTVDLYVIDNFRTEMFYDSCIPKDYLNSFLEEYKTNNLRYRFGFSTDEIDFEKKYIEVDDEFEIKAKLKLSIGYSKKVWFYVYVNVYFYFKNSAALELQEKEKTGVLLNRKERFNAEASIIKAFNRFSGGELRRIDQKLFGEQLLEDLQIYFCENLSGELKRNAFKHYIYAEFNKMSTDGEELRVVDIAEYNDSYDISYDNFSNESSETLFDDMRKSFEEGLFVNFKIFQHTSYDKVVYSSNFQDYYLFEAYEENDRSDDSLVNIEELETPIFDFSKTCIDDISIYHQNVLEKSFSVDVLIYSIDLHSTDFSKRKNLGILRFVLS